MQSERHSFTGRGWSGHKIVHIAAFFLRSAPLSLTTNWRFHVVQYKHKDITNCESKKPALFLMLIWYRRQRQRSRERDHKLAGFESSTDVVLESPSPHRWGQFTDVHFLQSVGAGGGGGRRAGVDGMGQGRWAAMRNKAKWDSGGS